MPLFPEKLTLSYTVFIRIVAAATINFAPSSVRLLIEGGSYSRAATIYYPARACAARGNVIGLSVCWRR